MESIKHIFNTKQVKVIKNLSISSANSIVLPVIILSTLFVFLLVYSFNFQIIHSNQYLLKASQLNIKETYIESQRGIFYDTNNIALVKNIQRYDVYIKNKNYTLANIAKVSTIIKSDLNLDDKVIKDIFINLKKVNYDLKIKSNLNTDESIKLQNDLQNDMSLYFKSGLKREYTYPQEFSHILGYTGAVTDNDLKKDYVSEDQIGKYKLELQLEDKLKGIKGKSIYIDGIETRANSQPGDNVYLTINSQWQNELYKILSSEIENLGAAGGAGVIIDDTNGNVVSLVSYPGFDSNLFIDGISNNQYENYLNNREKPLIDKAIGLQAAPGSDFKIITTYSLLENNIINPDDIFFSNRCMALGGGSNFCEYHQLFYGSMNLIRALYKSSNLYFCNSMLKMSAVSKLDNFVEAAKLFNIGEKTGINLIGEANGNMDSPEYRKSTLNLNWFNGDTCNAAIGQGAILVTPIQMAMVDSALVNNGKYYQPNIIDRITDASGNIIQQNSPIIQKVIPIQDRTLNLINQGMYDVAHYPQGTVYPFLFDVPGNIKAKTGTAEVYENVNGKQIYRTHGWIVGSFDYNGKTYSFTFHMNFGGGGYYIGKSLREFINCVYNNFNMGCEKK